MKISCHDKTIHKLIQQEERRQREGLELIPSENYASSAVRSVMSSVLTNKYSEGYPKRRYYGGNEIIDEVELVAQERAKQLFRVPYVNVQPYSGSPANLAVHLACCAPGDVVMGLDLTHGGHLTHGWKVSATGVFFTSIFYHVKDDGRIDFDEVARLAKAHKPKLIWCGATTYPFLVDFETFGEIADDVGAYLAADIAHISGLVVGGVHPSPVPHAHIVTTTTHKTLRGPRGGMIMVTEKGLKKDPELPDKIDKAVFPGLQGGPHDHQTAAIAVALREASMPEFQEYAKQIVKNSKILAKTLMDRGISLAGNGTENHLLLINLVPILGPGGGIFGQMALDFVHMTMNKNTIPGEPMNAFYPSGLRLGTPAATTRGMKEDDMIKIGNWIADVLFEIRSFRLPEDKEKRKAYIQNAKIEIEKNKRLLAIKESVREFCLKFPIP
ncbi:MAG: serine hydroxymethyltransferase [Patescibacteria group bacterium]|nr:serine hydroxymethyltransferase [Patescibacteria group bacterium]